MKLCSSGVCFALWMLAVSSSWAATYYVDTVSGKDSNSGTEPSFAWATLAPVNTHIFHAGDRLMFHAGQTWQGQLAPHGSGTRAEPIVLSRYGEGAKPLFQGRGVDATLLLDSVSGWTVEDIAVTNHGSSPEPGRVGVMLHTGTFSFALHLVRVDVSDVNGAVESKSSGGIGIYAWDKSADGKHELARFDDVLIDHCTVSHVDGEGIFSMVKKEGHTYPDTHVRLTSTTITDTGRNAVFLRATLGALIDHNTVRFAAARTHGNAVCVGWAKDTTIRDNEIWDTGIRTGDHENGAIDVDDGAIGTIVEYNWTHGNVGGSVNAGAMPDDDAAASGTVIRYNLSENDGSHAFGIGGAVADTAIYNNTVFVGKGHSMLIVQAGQFTHHPQLPEGILFARNVVFNAGSAGFSWHANRILIDGNCYLGHTPGSMPKEPHAAKDKLPEGVVAPITSRDEAVRYAVPAGSACAEPYVASWNLGTQDFLGAILNAGSVMTRGAVVASK